MQSIIEAISYLRSKGFSASEFDVPVEGSVRIAGRRVLALLGEREISLDQHLFCVFPEGKDWIVRDCNLQVEIDERFDSLERAVHTLADHLAEWLADDGESFWIGFSKRPRREE